MGFCVLAGLFEPVTAVELYEMPSEAVLRADGGTRVGRRLADSSGTVGFDGLNDGARFIARGFDVDGKRFEVRCRALRAGEGSFLSQPPVLKPAAPVGTSERIVSDPAPALPFAILQSGVPDGVAQAA